MQTSTPNQANVELRAKLSEERRNKLFEVISAASKPAERPMTKDTELSTVPNEESLKIQLQRIL